MTRSAAWFALAAGWWALGATAACSSPGGNPLSGSPDATADADGSSIAGDAASDTATGGEAGADASGPGEAAVDGGAAEDLGPMAAYCAQLAGAYCNRRAYCSGRPDPSCVPETTAACRMSARAQIVEALDAGVVAFDAVKAAACFASPFEDFCQPEDFGALEACRGVFQGTIPLGAPCLRVYLFGDLDECKDGSCSVGEVYGACVPGTCQPFLGAGSPCVDDAGSLIGPGCGPGYSCAAGVCAIDGRIGDPCLNPGELCRPTWPQVECAPLADGGLACDQARIAGGLCAYQEAGVDEVCRSQTCGADGGCTDLLVDGGIVCGATAPPCASGTACQPNGKDPPSCQPPRGPGAACLPGDVCSDGFTCAPNGDGGTSTCVALPAIGAPCAGACAPGATCTSFGDAGTCVAIVPEGGACRGAGDDTCAPGLTCNATSKTCLPFAGWSAACAADGDCERGLYCDDAARLCRTWKRHGAPCARDGECIFGSGCSGGLCESACNLP